MITGMTIVTVWVLDQDSAKEFYTKQLGFDLTTDIPLDSGMRWLTVRSSGGQEFLLLDPARSMLDAETGEQVRALVAKGALEPWRDGHDRLPRRLRNAGRARRRVHPAARGAPVRRGGAAPRRLGELVQLHPAQGR